MNHHKARELAETASVATLATVGPTGRIDLVPITFAFENDLLVSAIDNKPKRTPDVARLDNIRKAPEIALLCEHYDDDWDQLWWVRIRGIARVVEGGADYNEAIGMLVEKYDQYKTDRPTGAVIRVDVTEWSGWLAAENKK